MQWLYAFIIATCINTALVAMDQRLNNTHNTCIVILLAQETIDQQDDQITILRFCQEHDLDHSLVVGFWGTIVTCAKKIKEILHDDDLASCMANPDLLEQIYHIFRNIYPTQSFQVIEERVQMISSLQRKRPSNSQPEKPRTKLRREEYYMADDSRLSIKQLTRRMAKLDIGLGLQEHPIQSLIQHIGNLDIKS